MRERKIDIFDDEIIKVSNAICFTSNGVVKKNGELVMGAGVAKEFSVRWGTLGKQAGELVEKNGNVCQVVSVRNFTLSTGEWYNVSVVSFPTKIHFKDPADLSLILRSARRLQEIIIEKGWSCVALPRPGAGLGQLEWSKVRKELDKILDNRVVVVYK